LHKPAKRLVMRLWPVSSFSACGNLNKWKCSFLCAQCTEMQWYEYWKEARLKWHLSLGLGAEKYRYHDHLKLAHYANAACDIEHAFPFGFKELEGIHSRTDFDLKQHEQFSGKKLQYFDPELNQSYVPYVVETSVGLDRLFLAVLSSGLKEEQLENDTRTVLNLPPALAPYKAAVFPLIKKDGLPELADEIMRLLKFDFNVAYDEKDTVGKRYRRQDAIGTPFCITVDHQSLEDKTVTVRHRDTMQQERIAIADLHGFMNARVSLSSLLKSL
jgi:glycyl-tRNA synthetase